MAVNPFYQILAPTIMSSVGLYLTSKDANKTGGDDAVGSILIAATPAVTIALDGTSNQKALRKSMVAIVTAAQGWLDANPE